MGTKIGTAGYLSQAKPYIQKFPFSMGMWVYPNNLSGANSVIFFLGVDSATYTKLYSNTTTLTLELANGGSPKKATIPNMFTLNQWTYLVLEYTNGTVPILFRAMTSSGVISSNSATPPGSNLGTNLTLTLGGESPIAGNNFTGVIAEFWMSNSVIQPDGLALSMSTMRTLMERGPFAFPHIKQNLATYHSFRQSFPPNHDVMGEVYPGPKGREIWTSSSATVGPHPPLTGDYDSFNYTTVNTIC